MNTQSTSRQDNIDAIRRAAYDFRYGAAGAIVVKTEQAKEAGSIVLLDREELVEHNGGQYTFFGIMRDSDPEVMERRFAELFSAGRSLQDYNGHMSEKGQLRFSMALAHEPLSPGFGPKTFVGPVRKLEDGYRVEACLTSGVPTNTRPGKDGERVFTVPKYVWVDIEANLEGQITRILETSIGCFFDEVDGVDGRVPVIKAIRLRRPFLKKNATEADKEGYERALAKYEDQLLDYPDGVIRKLYEGPEAESDFVAAHTRETGDRTVWGFDKAVFNAVFDALDSVVEESRPKKSAAQYLARGKRYEQPVGTNLGDKLSAAFAKK